MNLQEFLQKMSDMLDGEVSQEVVQYNLSYYREYILDEMRKGRTEQEVLEELGDPRLIARTIIDSQESAGESRGGYEEAEHYTYGEAGENQNTYGGSAGQGNYGGDMDREEKNGLWERIRPTVIIAGVVLVILIILSIVFSALAFVLTSPVFWVIFVVFILWRVFFC